MLPQELLQCKGKEFATQVSQQKQRLLVSFDEDQITQREIEFASLRATISNNPPVEEDFNKSWVSFSHRFPLLCDFCGGMATLFPTTATVESDFSNLKWEKDDFRCLLTDFSLEELRAFSDRIERGVFARLTVSAAIDRKRQIGGTARERVEQRLKELERSLR
jgi:hypothetical protein